MSYNFFEIEVHNRIFFIQDLHGQRGEERGERLEDFCSLTGQGKRPAISDIKDPPDRINFYIFVDPAPGGK